MMHMELTQIVSCTRQTHGASRVFRPCYVFDLHFDKFDRFIFKAEKPLENVCATRTFPVVNSVSEITCNCSKASQDFCVN